MTFNINMRIYADSSITEFDKFMGKDLWISVGWDNMQYAWVRVISKEESKYYSGKYYYCMNVLTLDNIYEHLYDFERLKIVMNNVEKGIPLTHYDIIRPVEVVTTDELWDMIISQAYSEGYEI